MHLFLPALLNQLPIQTPADYHKLIHSEQAYLCTRLYSAMELEAQAVLDTLKGVGGLKLHFNVTRLDRSLLNIPSAVFLRKASFFATKTIITFPFDHQSPDGHVVDALLRLLWDVRPFLDEGFVNVFPSDIGFGKAQPSSFYQRYHLTPANFHLDDLRVQFDEVGVCAEHENAVLVSSICLPHFTNVKASDVIRVRNDESETYEDFEIELSHRLSTAQAGSEDKLLAELKAIHRGVRDANKKYDGMMDADKNERWDELASFLRNRIGLVMLMPKDVRDRLLQHIQDQEHYRDLLPTLRMPRIDSTTDWELEEAYLLWRVHQRSLPPT